jgi:uncharacterized protein YukJ
MPFSKYGVLAGTVKTHFRDNPDTQGRWYHVNVKVDASGQEYRCAIDVDSKQSATGVEWKVVPLRKLDWSALLALAPGYHELARTATSGAIDYIRTQGFQPRLGCVFVTVPDPWIRRLMELLSGSSGQGWQQGTSVEAAAAIEPLLDAAVRIFVFGEPFSTGLGMHNIHQNQGDPAGSQWWDENGIWQDGGTVIERADGSLAAFLNKFTSQAYKTDSGGHPL